MREEEFEPILEALSAVKALRDTLWAASSYTSRPELFKTWFTARGLSAETNFR